MPEVPTDWKTDGADARRIDDLKARIADRYPVLLWSGLTPMGHPVSPLDFMAGVLLDEVRKQIGPHSGVVPTIVSYQLARTMTVPPDRPGLFTESAFAACRVAAGYDDDRQVLRSSALSVPSSSGNIVRLIRPM